MYNIMIHTQWLNLIIYSGMRMENDPFEQKCAQQMFLYMKGCVEIQGFISTSKADASTRKS